MHRIAVVVAVALSLAGWLASTAGAKVGVPPADRAAIDRTLDVFVPAAIGRRHSERAWPLATAAMRRGGNRASWAKGFMPVTPFPVIGTSFHGWTVDRMARSRADIVLLVHLEKGAPLGAVSFDIAMRKVGGRWLVDSAVPAATFATPGSDSKVLAQPDFAPQPGQAFSKTGRISEKWVLIIPGILLGLIVLTPILVVGAHRLGDRRVRRKRSEADRRRVFRNLPERPN
ncbi:MAG: hypothetical protein ACM3QU_08145 [Verrucomicrobiota bacterium]